jgi:AraC-like DNA-binding protein
MSCSAEGIVNPAMRAAPPQSSVRLLYPFAAALREEGVDLDTLLAAADIPRSTWENRDARIPYTAARRFHFAAAGRTRNPALGLAAARHFALAQFQILEYFVATNTHVGPALDALVQNERVLGEAKVITLEPRAEGVLVRVDPVEAGAHRCWFEFVVATLYLAGQRIRSASGVVRRRSLPWFAHSAPGNMEDYEAFFGGPVRFEAPANGLLIPPVALQQNLESADTGLREVLRDHLERLMRQPLGSPSLLDRARSLVGESLAEGDPGMKAIAARLHMSRSTLQRRLHEQGTTHRNILQEVRRDLALRNLQKRDLSIAEVAYLVGYDDPTAFHRAFKKWTGSTPAEHRARMQREATANRQSKGESTVKQG